MRSYSFSGAICRQWHLTALSSFLELEMLVLPSELLEKMWLALIRTTVPRWILLQLQGSCQGPNPVSWKLWSLFGERDIFHNLTPSPAQFGLVVGAISRTAWIHMVHWIICTYAGIKFQKRIYIYIYSYEKYSRFYDPKRVQSKHFMHNISIYGLLNGCLWGIDLLKVKKTQPS